MSSKVESAGFLLPVLVRQNGHVLVWSPLELLCVFAGSSHVDKGVSTLCVSSNKQLLRFAVSPAVAGGRRATEAQNGHKASPLSLPV